MHVPKVIVLGGYGLIGSACMRALEGAGYDVTGIGRSSRSARAVAPDAKWILRDIPSITEGDWRNLLANTDVVVNASGALQDGARDDLQAIHVTAVERLARAASTLPVRVIQISAAGVSEEASTAFFSTKAQGDRLLSGIAKDWIILRPTLVLSQEAYGGTALLRAAAALPGTLPVLLPKTPIQTVYIGDVTEAVLACVRGDVPPGTIADLTEDASHSFPDLLVKIRRWQGRPAASLRLPIPTFLMTALGRVADLCGHMGWRSPLRTTALRVLADGIKGDPRPWNATGATPCRTLDETLAALPATRQERLFARAFFAMPLAIATLALFWVSSGLITLIDPHRAMSVLTQRDVAGWMTAPTVLGGAIADILLGAAILLRPFTKGAALGMVGLSGAYLLGSLIFAPDLWADPLGPMVKVFPGMALALLVWLMMEDR